jgi:hypothetical protein
MDIKLGDHVAGHAASLTKWALFAHFLKPNSPGIRCMGDVYDAVNRQTSVAIFGSCGLCHAYGHCSVCPLGTDWQTGSNGFVHGKDTCCIEYELFMRSKRGISWENERQQQYYLASKLRDRIAALEIDGQGPAGRAAAKLINGAPPCHICTLDTCGCTFTP